MNESSDIPQSATSPCYLVRKIKTAIRLSGKGDDAQWKAAHPLTDFSYPWETAKPRATTFHALHSNDWLYCLFQVTDPAVHIFVHDNDKREVAASSRVEIFFKINDALAPYYCLELDPAGRIFDYRAHYYRKFDTDWSWPERQLIVKTHQTGNGYTVEVAIAKESLKHLQLLKEDKLFAGLYRADCFPNGTNEPDFKWISWIKPDSPAPDFHIPSSFGCLQLED